MLHFLRPEWFWGLLPLSILLLLFYIKPQRQSRWKNIIAPYLVDELAVKPAHGSRLAIFLIFIFWLITIFALAGPTWKQQPQPLFKNNQAVVIALDLSSQMLRTDIKPNLITRARYKIEDILNKYKDGRMGMVAFTNEAYTVSPLTQDNHTLLNMVTALTPAIMPVDGENLSVAMLKAAKLLWQADAPHGTILLITTAVPNAKDYRIAADLHSKGLLVSVLAMGFNKNDFSGLAHLVALGGGHFASFTNDDADETELLNSQANSAGSVDTQQTNAHHWYDEGRYFIMLLIPLLLLAFRRGVLEELL
ncbi:MAG: VWA domain-containing protein [Pseudomonadota bacterium]